MTTNALHSLINIDDDDDINDSNDSNDKRRNNATELLSLLRRTSSTTTIAASTPNNAAINTLNRDPDSPPSSSSQRACVLMPTANARSPTRTTVTTIVDVGYTHDAYEVGDRLDSDRVARYLDDKDDNIDTVVDIADGHGNNDAQTTTRTTTPTANAPTPRSASDARSLPAGVTVVMTTFFAALIVIVFMPWLLASPPCGPERPICYFISTACKFGVLVVALVVFLMGCVCDPMRWTPEDDRAATAAATEAHQVA